MKPSHLLGALAFVVILGLLGHQDFKAQQLSGAVNTCRYQTTETIPTFNQCIDNQLELNGDK